MGDREPLLVLDDDYANEVDVAQQQTIRDDALNAFSIESLDPATFEAKKHTMGTIRTLAAFYFIFTVGFFLFGCCRADPIY